MSGSSQYNGFVWFCTKRQWKRPWNLSGYARKLVETTANGFVWFCKKSVFKWFFERYNGFVWFCM